MNRAIMGSDAMLAWGLLYKSQHSEGKGWKELIMHKENVEGYQVIERCWYFKK